MAPSIIVIDDDSDYLTVLAGQLSEAGFSDITLEADPIHAAGVFEAGKEFDIALVDITMPHMDGFQLLDTVKHHSPTTECIMVTAVNDAKLAMECIKKGAYDYLVKPVAREDLVFSVSRALERKRLLDILDIEKGTQLPALKNAAPFKAIVTQSPAVMKILKEAELHAASDVPLLITGESGTGKELLANAVHNASHRSGYPFTPVNMASLTPSVFDAEFFGHTKGAFTGAEKSRVGYLEFTDKGTLFLDEIGNMPPDLQGKLLRVLQDGEYLKLGTSRQQRVDVRFIAATNADLQRLMAQNAFRKDLYYRIRGGWLHLPPLRERPEDISLLAGTFLRQYCGDTEACCIEEDALQLLRNYSFPGNIRELKSIMQSAANLADGRPLAAAFFPDYLQSRKRQNKPSTTGHCPPVISLAEAEKRHILNVYRDVDSNKAQAARLLGIGLATLKRKLKRYGVA